MITHFRKHAMLVFLALSLFLQACRPTVVEQPEPVTLKVVLLPFLSYAPYYVGEQEGYFAEQGLEIEWVELRRSSEAYAALAEGDIDVSSGFGVGWLNAIARGANMRAVASRAYIAPTGCTAQGLVARTALVEAGELESPSDLEGLTISYEAGSVFEYSMDLMLSPVDLTLDDIEHVDISNPDELAALESGAIDVASAGEPWITRMVQSGHGVLWMGVEEILPGFQHSVVLYGRNLMENPDVGRRFMVAYLKSVRKFGEGKTERNLELTAEFSGLDEEFVMEACWPSIHEDGTINVQSVLDFQAWSVEKGYLDSVVPEDQFWDPSFSEYANQVLESASQ